MTTEELITNQQLEIEEFKRNSQENNEIIKGLHGMFYSIGQPLNDNILKFNKDQRKWCHELIKKIELIN